MNDKRRKELRHAIGTLEVAEIEISSVMDREEDAMDNVPESLQDTDMYERMEEAVEKLDEACDIIHDAIYKIREVI